VSWSGGKDSAMAFHRAMQDPGLDVVGLLTTVTAEYDRISIHGVRTSLLRAQCAAAEKRLIQVDIPPQCSNEQYEAALQTKLIELRERGIKDLVFGDLFLADIRAYRERVLGEVGMNAHFPLWGSDTAKLARSCVDDGWRAVVVCVDPVRLPEEVCGREFDHSLLDELPADCDPCAERGEFHTFAYGGPVFREQIKFDKGDVVNRGPAVYIDLVG
jgi:uncharacterized protein (TIGR00290 family)